MKIAVLITCHNRRNKTLNCLKSLFANSLPDDCLLEVYLVDDGSMDGTSKAVNENFPQVFIIQGNGSLYWNNGMRLAWKSAIQRIDYDFYFWLNDDTFLDESAINEMLNCHFEAMIIDGKEAIIVGACRASNSSNVFSYGGRTMGERPVLPNGSLQTCVFINGNSVLVPKKIYKTLGNLSSDYTHSIADFDYGLRSIKSGYKIYTTKNYIAVCARNELPAWSNPEISFRERLKLFKSPKGLNIDEYLLFRRKFWGIKWLAYGTKAYARVLFPSIYNFLKG